MVSGARLLLAQVVAAASIALATSGHAAPLKVDPYYSKTYTTCLDAAGGSTMPMRDCIGAEHDSWDASLNKIYQALMASPDGPPKLQLRDEERAWIKRTAKTCDHAGDDEQGGSLQGVEIDMCYLDETIRRAVYLRSLH
jgi:uncharacterized protein YecT (DUF1311 family)